tara:strand:- start:356 stop:676 length:321 start_codon:yes stop_codon:yes gene_type:complete
MNSEKIREKKSIKPQSKTSQAKSQEKPIDIASFVKEQVIGRLGKPDTLKYIRANNVFDNNWRVDVWCHFESEVAMIKPANIKHSYFVKVDEHGKFISSSPEIKKEY